nr:hypothetical protein [Azospirillum sp. SYSU D00513]
MAGVEPSLRRPAPSGDRARHVHRAGPALPGRAGRRPQSPRVRRLGGDPHLHPRQARDGRAADRARHERGHEDLRPCRRAGLRTEDLRRRSGLREERPGRDPRLPRRGGGRGAAAGGRRRSRRGTA